MRFAFAQVIVSIIVLAAYPRLSALRASDDAGSAYKPELGSLKVKAVPNLVLNDAKRNKQQMRIHYPDGAGPFPLIVWSHGAGGSKDNYLGLMEHWASHSYVTVHHLEGQRQIDSL
jgi:predicted dienelactone hydrolase